MIGKSSLLDLWTGNDDDKSIFGTQPVPERILALLKDIEKTGGNAEPVGLDALDPTGTQHLRKFAPAPFLILLAHQHQHQQ